MSAAIYGKRLRNEMRYQGVLSKRLVEEAGVQPAYLVKLRKGEVIPRLDLSQRIADVLMCPALHEYVVSLRRRACEVCEASFLANNKSFSQRRYCSRACASARSRVGTVERYRDERARYVKLATFRLHTYQEAVNEHCRECEPGGLCQTPDCRLREVSPLPLVRIA